MTQAVLWPWILIYPALVLILTVGVWQAQRLRPGFGRRTLLTVSVGSAVIYLIWRVAFTIPTETPAAMVVGITLVAVEIIGLVQTLAFTAVVWSTTPPRPVPLSALPSIPSVDVFIATYNEPVSMLRTTVAGALGMRYPGTVTIYLCDDGGRDAVGQLAAEFGVEHLTREDHSHAKAGNLNNALAVSHGEIVVTLDADMIPRANFLEATVGHFIDDRLAFVQAPQAFYNQDPFQYNLFSGKALPNEQDFFMRTLQSGKNRFNAVMYVGSNTLFRRTALEKIGGFATGVITEDVATGMLLQAEKYRATFVPQVVAAGLAPETLPDLLRQRDRWARGNIQAARKWNPLTWPGLTPMQRALYVDGVIYWYFGVFKLVYVLAPLFFLILGIPAVTANLASLAVFWLPFFVSSMLSFAVIADRKRSFLWSHVYELAMAPTLAVSTLAETAGLKVSAFAVTPKGKLNSNRQFHWRIALPHLVLLGLSVLGLVNVFVLNPGQFDRNSIVISVFWTLYNMAGLAMAVLLCIERPRVRAAERAAVECVIEADLPGIGVISGRAVDLSIGGARISLPWTDGFRPELLADVPLRPTSLSIDGVGAVTGQSRWVIAGDDSLTVGFAFGQLSAAQTVGIVGLITASADWVRDDRETGAGLAASAGRAVAGTVRRVTAHARADVRVPTNAPALVRLLSIQEVCLPDDPNGEGRHRAAAGTPVLVSHASDALEAAVVDYSFGGCRLRVGERLEPGDFVSVEIPDRLETPELAQVRWVQRHRGSYRVGLSFGRSEAPVAVAS
ncbi:MAG: glycosyltransferase family 2 protein [Microbacteriaceae bacterium]